VGADAEGIDIAYRRALDAADGDALSATNRSFHAYDANIKTFDDDDATDDLMSFDWRERWRSLKPLVVIDKPRGAKDQMALDQRLAQEVAEGIRPATLRFWNWSESAVVVGRFQSIPDQVDTDQAWRLGFDVVRRPTGGGAMFVQPQGVITYSLYAPMDFVAGVSVSQSYKLCDAWLLAALESLGFDARFSGLNDISSMYGKIGGSAQRRYSAQKRGSGAVLHHTMLDWDLDAALMARVLKVSREKLSDKSVPSAVKRIDALSRQTSLTQDEITNRLFAFVSGGI
jgi:lipoate---protein ligase